MAGIPVRRSLMNEIQRTDIPLVEIVDRLLDKGVVLAGGATISVAGVDLIELRLNVVLAAQDTLARSMAERTHLRMLVTLRWSVPRRSDSTTGTDYLLARASERREAERLVERLVTELGVERALIRERISPQVGVAATVVITIEDDEEMSVRRSVQRFARSTNEVTVDLGGPFAS